MPIDSSWRPALGIAICESPLCWRRPRRSWVYPIIVDAFKMALFTRVAGTQAVTLSL